MKRSKKIALTLMASVSIAAFSCSEEQQAQREIYATKEQCVRDWSAGDECERDVSSNRYFGPRYFFYGGYPHYYRSGGTELVPVSKDANFSNVKPGMRSPHSIGSFAVTHVSRGGFGKSSAFHGGGS